MLRARTSAFGGLFIVSAPQPMPIEHIGKEKVLRIRHATPEEDALAYARQISLGVDSSYDFAPNLLEIEGRHLHYVDEGPRDAAPILCLHGNPTWSYYWRGLISGLRSNHRVIAPDHMGMGLSEKPLDWPYRLEAHVGAMERLVIELDLTEITLVVHDWGGAIGMGLAMRHPERIARIVVTNSAAFTEGPAHPSLVAAKLPGLNQILVRGMGLFNQAAVRFATKGGLSEEERRSYLAPYTSAAGRVGVQNFVKDIPLSPGHPSYHFLSIIEAGLAKIEHLPMQIIWGMQDWVFTPEFLQMWRDRFPGARVQTIAHAGHLLMEDAGGEVLEVVKDFLASPATPAGAAQVEAEAAR